MCVCIYTHMYIDMHHAHNWLDSGRRFSYTPPSPTPSRCSALFQEHTKVLARRVVIERRKEEQERVMHEEKESTKR